MAKPTISELMAQAGISKSYACEILGGRAASRSVAIRIFRTTGWKPAPIEALTDDEINALEQIERRMVA